MDCGFKNDEGWFRYRAAAIIIEDGCVLMASNNLTPYYYSVGGGVQLHEMVEDAVKREVFEETVIKEERNTNGKYCRGE
ncbi:MAG: hydrolase, nudix family [Clostridiaceae bacterium]|jgi:ADP-ribose pyrophosphatase YjhB (NUDIX family)|nr:hydrolase, nudix family [Clostridiaceae bacterium]